MRMWVLLCCAVVVGQLAWKSSKRFEEVPAEQVSEPLLALPVTLDTEGAQPAASARKPSLLSLLTLSVAVIGAVSGSASTGPYDADAQLTARIVDTTAQLEATAARLADHRAASELARR